MKTIIEVPPGYRATLFPVSQADAAVLAALDRLWVRIRKLNPGVPELLIEIGPGADSSCSGVGWDQPHPVLKLNLRREDRNATGAELLERLLHFATHAATGPTFTTEGHWHSAAYRDNAASLGLVAEPVSTERKVGGHGWSRTSLADGTPARYSAQIQSLDRALSGWEPEPVARAERSSRNGRVLSCSCVPARKIRVRGKESSDDAPIICGACHLEFLPS